MTNFESFFSVGKDSEICVESNLHVWRNFPALHKSFLIRRDIGTIAIFRLITFDTNIVDSTRYISRDVTVDIYHFYHLLSVSDNFHNVSNVAK